MSNIPRNEWVWYIVVDAEGNFMDGFNSLPGAVSYAEDFGGLIIKVREIN